jgi:FAD/FMN-containing dehydrogenase
VIVPPVTPAPAPPLGFRGDWITGEDAHLRGSRVSGPFRASPEIWAAPATVEDVARVLEASQALGLPVVPRGGGTGMPGGNLGPGIILSLESLTELAPGTASAAAGSREGTGTETGTGTGTGTGTRDGAEELRVRAGAGVTVAAVESWARARGYTFPPLPSSAPWATVGGVVANNAAGARSFGYGATANWVTALEGVLADGRFIRVEREGGEWAHMGLGIPAGALLDRALLDGWPAVRKNSSGYALDRFFQGGGENPLPLLLGSEGTLLVVTAVEFRLIPAPTARGVYLLPVPSAEALGLLAAQAPYTGAVSCEFLGERLLQVLAAVADPVFVEGLVPAGGYAVVLLEFEGEGADALQDGFERARALGTEHGGPGFGTGDPEVASRLWGLRHRASPLIQAGAGEGRVSTQFIEDSVVPPGALGAYVEGVSEILRDEATEVVLFGHAGDGNVHVNPLLDPRRPDERDRVRRILDRTVSLVSSLGGTLAGEHGDGRLRTPFARQIWGDRRVDAFQRIKEAFDPDGRLNPGVKVPLPGQDPLDGFHPVARRHPG